MTEKKKSESLKLPAAARWIREILAVICWGLVVVQIFIFDVTNYLAGNIEGFEGKRDHPGH